MKRRLDATQSMLKNQPVLVIERSQLSLKEIVATAKQLNLTEEAIFEIRHTEICPVRWNISHPTIYIIYPCLTQAYLSRDMRHPHYQVFRKDGEARNLEALRRYGKRIAGLTLVEIKPTQATYCDDFLRVVNYPELEKIDTTMVREALRGKSKDPERNNICQDLGYAGHRNSRREAKYLGIAHSNLMGPTTQYSFRKLFVDVTKTLDDLFPDVGAEVYNDNSRNAVFAGEIAVGNRVEAMRLAETNEFGAIVNFHGDDQNCVTPSYAWVMGLSWFFRDEATKGLVRHAIITYGKQAAHEHMLELAKHREAILLHKRVFDRLPRMMKSQGSDVFPKYSPRVAYNFAFLDKGIFYSLFGSAITQVFLRYRLLCHDLLMISAFLANVVMSEVPDHYWMICKDLQTDGRVLGTVHISECNPFELGYAFMQEIFHRKESDVHYPTTQRHPPAVNRRPSKEQMDNTIRAIAMLIQETREKWKEINNTASALHYYGKVIEYLVEEAFGAGHLTAMHIVGVGACIGVFPPLFLSVAEVGITTRPWKFLKWAFGYVDETAYDSTDVLLWAIATVCDIPIMWAEELCCYVVKCLTSGNPSYDLCPCLLDFSKVSIGARRVGRYGDVVYSDMFLFRLHRKTMYHLDITGRFAPADELMMDSLLSRVLYNPVERFWSRKFKTRQSFHYKRNRVCSKVGSLRDYFQFDNDADDYVPRSTGQRSAARLPSDHIVFGLYGPSFVSIISAPTVREPLNLKQMVWQAMGGQLLYRKSSLCLLTSWTLDIVRPPCVHPSYAVIRRRQAFYSCCLVPQHIPVDALISNGRYWPSPLFDMIPSIHHLEEQPCPPEWKRSVVFGNVTYIEPRDDSGVAPGLHTNLTQMGACTKAMVSRRRCPRRLKRNVRRKCVVDHTGRTEPNWLWNFCRQIPDSASPYGSSLVFLNQRMAVDFALAEFFFTNPSLFDTSDAQVRRMYFLDKDHSGGMQRSQRLWVNGPEEVRIFYDSTGFRPSIEKVPWLTAIRYPGGGMLYYFCGTSGERITYPLLRRPLSQATKSGYPEMHEFLSILSHRVKDRRSVCFRNCSTNLVIKWVDGTVTEEPMNVIFEGSPVEVVAYAERHSLLDEPGWGKVRSLSQAHLCKDHKPYLPIPVSMNMGTKPKPKAKRKLRLPNERVDI